VIFEGAQNYTNNNNGNNNNNFIGYNENGTLYAYVGAISESDAIARGAVKDVLSLSGFPYYIEMPLRAAASAIGVEPLHVGPGHSLALSKQPSQGLGGFNDPRPGAGYFGWTELTTPPAPISVVVNNRRVLWTDHPPSFDLWMMLVLTIGYLLLAWYLSQVCSFLDYSQRPINCGFST
jgi:hypothetical protein